LPVCPSETGEAVEYIYEPAPDELLLALLPRLIRFQIYQAFLESQVAENTSRMIAMHSATQNASNLIEDLTVNYNKARQQNITSEIMDIVGGTSALGTSRGM
jgi:F-type H+-transporting ATPase subunit gamma